MNILTCVYCDDVADSRDHVPPRGIFPSPKPSDLITVPSCTSCNQSFSKDDEYFKISLGLREDVRRSREGRHLARECIRALQRPESSNFAKVVDSTIRPPTAEEILEGADPDSVGQQPDSERLQRVIRRMIQGLHFHVSGRRLPVGYVVRGTLLEAYPEPYRSMALSKFAGAPITELAAGQFAYVTRAAVDDVFTSVWLLTFYAAASFHGATGQFKS
jgi:hypothetical protein